MGIMLSIPKCGCEAQNQIVSVVQKLLAQCLMLSRDKNVNYLFSFSPVVPCALSSTWGLLKFCLSRSPGRLISHALGLASSQDERALSVGECREVCPRGGPESWGLERTQ